MAQYYDMPVQIIQPVYSKDAMRERQNYSQSLATNAA